MSWELDKMTDLNNIHTNTTYKYKGCKHRNVLWPIRCVDCEKWNPDLKTYNGEAPCDEWSDYENGMTRYTSEHDFCSKAEVIK